MVAPRGTATLIFLLSLICVVCGCKQPAAPGNAHTGREEDVDTTPDTRPMTLEYDWVAGTEAVTSSDPDPTCGSTSLTTEYAKGHINLSVPPQPAVERDPNMPIDPNDCPSSDAIDRLLQQTRQPVSGQWYAHGLVLPYKGYRNPTDPRCTRTPKGMLWLLPGGQRQDFVVFYHSKYGGTTAVWRRDLFKTGLHELAHVLNLHECDFMDDTVSKGCFKNNGTCVKHLRRHEAGLPPEHVEPGATGHVWCAGPGDSWHRSNNHGKCYNACSVERARETMLDRVATLTVTPEKGRYLPGEPITVMLSLSTSDPKQGFLSDESLDPALGHVGFVVRAANGRSTAAPLAMPIYEEVDLEEDLIQSATGPRERFAEIWYTLPDAGIEPDESFLIRAHYGGLAGRPGRLESPETAVTVNRGPSGDAHYNEDAYRLFIHPESRRFVHLMGGNHLATGKTNLEEIARRYPETIYAAYASLALGFNAARRFDTIEERHGRQFLTSHPPNLAEARGYLDTACGKRSLLPPRYRSILEIARETAHLEPCEPPSIKAGPR